MPEQLIALQAGSHYIINGGTNNHPGPHSNVTYPPDPIVSDDPHNLWNSDPYMNYNHWGSSDASDFLVALANDFHANYPNAGSLWYNDMLLVYGGGFDIEGNWEADTHAIPPNHGEHNGGKDGEGKENGTSCDFYCNDFTPLQRETLDLYISNHLKSGDKPVKLPEGNHWHLRIYGFIP